MTLRIRIARLLRSMADFVDGRAAAFDPLADAIDGRKLALADLMIEALTERFGSDDSDVVYYRAILLRLTEARP